MTVHPHGDVTWWRVSDMRCPGGFNCKCAAFMAAPENPCPRCHKSLVRHIAGDGHWLCPVPNYRWCNVERRVIETVWFDMP